MAVQNPFFGKRDPEPFVPRQPLASQGVPTGATAGSVRTVEAPAAAAPAANAGSAGSAGSKLTVGPNIKLKGVEITDCDTLVVEGTVEATMDSRVIQIAQQGAFRGSADIDIAEIHGEFNGTLTVRHKLVIYGTGRVKGKIRYGKLVVEEGGELEGEITAGPVSAPASVAPAALAATTVLAGSATREAALAPA